MTPDPPPPAVGSSRPMPAGFREDVPERVLAPTTRADGSVRKPVRIRAGYVNQDEVAKYTPGAFRRQAQEAQASGGPPPRASGGVGGRGGSCDTREARSKSSRVTSSATSGETIRDGKKSDSTSKKGDDDNSTSRSIQSDKKELESFEEWMAEEGVGTSSSDRTGSEQKNSIEGKKANYEKASPPKMIENEIKIDSPLDKWSALDEELEKALAGKKKNSRRR